MAPHNLSQEAELSDLNSSNVYGFTVKRGIFNALHGGHPTTMGNIQCPPSYYNGEYSMPSIHFKSRVTV